MKKWILRASIDAVNIDFETVIESEKEPDFWTCNNIAEEHNCNFWTVYEAKEKEQKHERKNESHQKSDCRL